MSGTRLLLALAIATFAAGCSSARPPAPSGLPPEYEPPRPFDLPGSAPAEAPKPEAAPPGDPAPAP
ncbi:hypothetical protein [Polyangium aurulentum]|uniref:hypothetical protein n=1 Tax=Polyangium aurulentum TaxID=2567896 RepID=UPI0010AED5BA|nr:hypothetical protein [Polyangium aurulentum]UQA56308.1 hypothetical protein E8A73_034070 [Polyangium aurulentum]